MQPAWAEIADDELLKLRICDLHVRIEGSELEPRIGQLYLELDMRGLPLKPECYLGDEWFSPEGSPTIAIPFYLAHPRLKQLELHQMLEVEGGTYEWCLQILRHECGHAYDHAFQFSSTTEWAKVFGNREAEYQPESYQPRPYSKSFVRHLPKWYAQAHPDEDFAETFAVWLTWPEEEWRAQYSGWKALKKLEYVDGIMKSVGGRAPLVSKGRRLWDASRSRRTLEKYYASKRRTYAEDFPDLYDADLREIFERGGHGRECAAEVLRRLKTPLIGAIVRWSGQRKYIIDTLVKRLIFRLRDLGLPAPRDHDTLQIELASYLAALVTNHVHTGKFKRRRRQ
jgi:hypothetical protein